MKYKPGTKVTITNVPERAKQFGVREGMPALVLEIDEKEAVAYCEDIGMTLVEIGTLKFWWKEDDLGRTQ